MHDSLTQINQTHKCTKYMKSSRSSSHDFFQNSSSNSVPGKRKNSLLPASPTAIGSIRDLRWVGYCQGQEIPVQGATFKFTKVLQVPNNQDVPPGHLDAVPQFRGDLMFFFQTLFFCHLPCKQQYCWNFAFKKHGS